jgi:hypothetical protein
VLTASSPFHNSIQIEAPTSVAIQASGCGSARVGGAVASAESRDCADDLLALGRRLRDQQPVDVRGIAMTALLLTAGTSPLDPDSGQRLRPVVRSARLALDGSALSGEKLPAAA